MVDSGDIKMKKGGLCPSQWNLYPIEETNIFLSTRTLRHPRTQEQLCKNPRRKFLLKLSAKKKISSLLTSFDSSLFLAPHPVYQQVLLFLPLKSIHNSAPSLHLYYMVLYKATVACWIIAVASMLVSLLLFLPHYSLFSTQKPKSLLKI